MSTTERDERSEQLQAEMRSALGADNVRFEITWALSLRQGGTTDGLTIEYKDYGQKRWTRVKTGVYPGEGQNLADVFQMLYDIRLEEREKREARG